MTQDEVTRFRVMFSSSIYNEATGENSGNPLACFLLGKYGDISQMSRSKFRSYYPTDEYGEEEEFQLLKKKYPDDFENEQTIKDLPVPIHRIHAEELEALMEEYTLIHWADLPQSPQLHDLEETDCYDTYYSDVGCSASPAPAAGSMTAEPCSAPGISSRS